MRLPEQVHRRWDEMAHYRHQNRACCHHGADATDQRRAHGRYRQVLAWHVQAPHLNIYCPAPSILSQILTMKEKICKAPPRLRRGALKTWHFGKTKICIEATVIDDVREAKQTGGLHQPAGRRLSAARSLKRHGASPYICDRRLCAKARKGGISIRSPTISIYAPDLLARADFIASSSSLSVVDRLDRTAVIFLDAAALLHPCDAGALEAALDVDRDVVVGVRPGRVVNRQRRLARTGIERNLPQRHAQVGRRLRRRINLARAGKRAGRHLRRGE